MNDYQGRAGGRGATGPAAPAGENTTAAGPPPRSLGRCVRQALVLAAIMVASLGCYLIVLRWRGPHAVWTTYTPWDEVIPFHPGWVWVYLVPYLVGPVAVGLLTPATFLWFVRRGLVVVCLTLVFFILVPTQTQDREERDLGDGLTARLYMQMVAIDHPPANAAPSLHVSLTCLLALALFRDFPRWWWLTGPGVGLVWLATLGTRQHHLLDVATGAALALGVVLVWPKRSAGC